MSLAPHSVHAGVRSIAAMGRLPTVLFRAKRVSGVRRNAFQRNFVFGKSVFSEIVLARLGLSEKLMTQQLFQPPPQVIISIGVTCSRDNPTYRALPWNASQCRREVTCAQLRQGSHAVVKVLDCWIGLQSLEKVLNLARVCIRYGRYGKRVEITNSSVF